MNRQPTLDIENTTFYVDVLHDELRQKDDPKNSISFSVFDQHGDGYTFLYDRATKNAADVDEAAPVMKDTYVWVTLPALMELDPEGIARKYDIPLSILCPDLQIKTEDDDEDEGYTDELF